MRIIRWKPLHEFEKLFEEMPLGDLAIDVYEENDTVVVEMHCPGIEPDKVDISVEDNLLRISGTREETEVEQKRDYYRKEIKRGDFERVVPLPCAVKSEEAMAEFENGILVISLPKKKPGESGKIKVKKK